MEKVDFKKLEKAFYLPGREPKQIKLPQMPYIAVDGTGAPDGESYQQAMELLYGLSFTIKMSRMGSWQPAGYYDYVVPPLEGMWYADSMALEREQWRWTSMIRQPEFVDQAVFTWASAQLAAKKPQLPVARARLLYHSDGLCVQMMHRGSYASEGKSFAAMTAFMQERGLVQRESWHREIYLGDPRRTREENLRTVLRLPVRQV